LSGKITKIVGAGLVPAQSADRLKHRLFAQVEFYLHLPASFRRFGQAQDLPLLGFSSFQQSLRSFWAKPKMDN
jgi:hypothetical protein